MSYPIGTKTVKTPARRTKLNAWDLALLDKLLEKHLKEIAFIQGEAYRSSVDDLAKRIRRATMGSLTEK